MRLKVATIVAIACAMSMPVVARADGPCAGASGANTSGSSVPTPSGTVYYAGNAQGDGGYVAHTSDSGYVQADGDARNGVRLHGSTSVVFVGVAMSVAAGPSGVGDLCVLGDDLA